MEKSTFAESIVWSVLGIFGLYLSLKLLRFGHREKNLPPGPPTLPILGNAHQIPTTHLYLKLKEWSDQYGPVYSLKVGKGTIIVLNDRRTVHDLIDKKSAIYSERPIDYNIEVATANENIAFIHATPLWRAQRKITSQNLAPRVLDDKVAPIQEAEFCQLMHDLLETPDQFPTHISRTTASIASIMMYGFRAPTIDSFWATCVYRSTALLNKALTPGSYLPIEHFPILKLIPDRWAPSKQLAKRAYLNTTQIWTEARNRVEERRRSGDERISLADRLLNGDVKTDVPLNRDQFNNFLGALHQGAADTTHTALLTIMLYLSKYPWVQKKAQIELDRICGTERMPTWADFKDLPYINCIIKECLRIRPILPVGIPHRAKQDDWFEGMLIPKDATIFVPAYALHQGMYSDSERFDPDRYLDRPKLAMDYAGSPDYMNRDHYAYGAGRRICPGIHLAERTQWRITARVLWAFKLEAKTDAQTGEKLELDTDAYVDGFIRQPEPFGIKITPRGDKYAEIIRRDLKNMEDYLKTWE